MKWKDLPWLLKQSFQEWYAANTFQLGAALAYYTVFSLAPILIIAIALASTLFGEEAARGHIVGEIRGTVGPQVGKAIQEMLQTTAETGSGTLATLISVGILIFSATAVFGQLQQAINTVWGIQSLEERGWLEAIKDRFWSFAVVVGIGFLLLVSLVISTVLSALTSFVTPAAMPGGAYLWQGVHLLISLGFITFLFALMFKLLPDVNLAWQDVWVGAAVTALLFSVGKHLIGLYLANSSWISAYGAAGSLVVILLWVFYSSQILLFGAIFTKVYANKFGRPVIANERAKPIGQDAHRSPG